MATRTPVVLLVQPERDDREMYAHFLRHQGFQPIPVSTAADGLTIAPGADVIVTAILLPGPMDGVEFIACLKRDARTAHTPVIVLTACAWNAERDRCLAGGCDVFLAKPCLPNVLVKEIRRVLAFKRVPKPKPATARPPFVPRFRRTS